jgi:hypothetical protein
MDPETAPPIAEMSKGWLREKAWPSAVKGRRSESRSTTRRRNLNCVLNWNRFVVDPVDIEIGRSEFAMKR